ncbi:MAG: hypothetical protein K8F54_06240 [Altibacter sp.]|uniref:hypothetical protein n=1 Tax=Altibacter sp. TaxID=2024823 RepID=UPI001DA4D0A5|nr:hypothetical protein [Altibacter sp.]MBZ0327187.1 hypothetical protein [Altibacter sp.]
MKSFLILFLLAATTFVYSQDISIPEPEFIGEIVYVASDNNPVDLEMQTASIRSGKSVGRMVTGAGKNKVLVVVKGAKSPVRIKKSDTIYFVYNNGSNDITPRKVIQLLEFESEKKTREYLFANSSNLTGQTTQGELNLINYKAKKYGETSYLIIVSNLPVGEYAFFLGDEESRDAYLFGVDE